MSGPLQGLTARASAFHLLVVAGEDADSVDLNFVSVVFPIVSWTKGQRFFSPPS